jgi:hypothetical protein
MGNKRISTAAQYGGIENKLDAEAALHNGFSYRHFELFQRLKIPKTIQGRLMNVHRSTIEDWQRQQDKLLTKP